MSRFISAIYHKNIEVAEFICDDGRHFLRSGGTLPWRINNPGDLTARLVDGVPAPKKAKGYVGFATTKSGRVFLIFPDEDAGRAELKANLKRMHGEKTILKAIPDYAPEKENNTQKYIEDLLKIGKIPIDKKIDSCSAEELKKIADSIAEIEGHYAKPETRKELWVVVSRINATDGSQPLPDAEIILQIGGKEKKVKSDAVGRFPPVIHSADKTPVYVKIVDSKTKESVKIGVIQGDVGKDFNLLAKFRKWKGVAGSAKINGSSFRQKKPMKYVVQPGDSLGNVAKLYRTNEAAIKIRNSLKSDTIYPGEVLLINGSGEAESSAAPTTATPKSTSTSMAAVPKKRSRHTTPPVPPIPSSVQPSDSERSKKGAGKQLALINTLSGRAPWMPIAIAEAKLRAGEVELTLQNKINYHIEIDDGLKSLYGPNNAWCAAFVNWCLLQAKYPIDNATYPGHRTAKARAHGFYEVSGPKEKTEKTSATIRNPLFVEIEKPIYGAIAMVTSKSDHGHHVGFVYAKNGANGLILLGGNQSQQINFSYFNATPVAGYTTKNKEGKKSRTRVIRII